MPHDALPTFFFSYARRDTGKAPSSKLLQFFEDLQETLEQRTPKLPDGVSLGTLDLRVTHTSDWDDELSHALKTNKALVAVATPTYFDKENCGKEIAVFARRHSAARLDSDGALRHASNILHIRWYEDAAYESNRIKDAALHPLLRKVTWTPAENGKAARSKAVHLYREKGMKMCVKPSRDYYDELLQAFADSVKNMPELPEATFPVSWSNIRSAFEADWTDVPREEHVKHMGVEGTAAAATPIVPSGPADVAAFYLTRRPLFRSTYSTFCGPVGRRARMASLASSRSQRTDARRYAGSAASDVPRTP
jgi:hypothetical protein